MAEDAGYLSELERLRQDLAAERAARQALEAEIARLRGEGAATDAEMLGLEALRADAAAASQEPADLGALALWFAEASLRAEDRDRAEAQRLSTHEQLAALAQTAALATPAKTAADAAPDAAPRALPANYAAIEAAEARARHNATQVRRLTEELAAARAEQMQTAARLRALEGKLQRLSGAALLADESLVAPPAAAPAPAEIEDFSAPPTAPAADVEELDTPLAGAPSSEMQYEAGIDDWTIATPSDDEVAAVPEMAEALDDALGAIESLDAAERQEAQESFVSEVAEALDIALEAMDSDDTLALDALHALGPQDLEDEAPTTLEIEPVPAPEAGIAEDALYAPPSTTEDLGQAALDAFGGAAPDDAMMHTAALDAFGGGEADDLASAAMGLLGEAPELLPPSDAPPVAEPEFVAEEFAAPPFTESSTNDVDIASAALDAFGWDQPSDDAVASAALDAFGAMDDPAAPLPEPLDSKPIAEPFGHFEDALRRTQSEPAHNVQEFDFADVTQLDSPALDFEHDEPRDEPALEDTVPPLPPALPAAESLHPFDAWAEAARHQVHQQAQQDFLAAPQYGDEFPSEQAPSHEEARRHEEEQVQVAEALLAQLPAFEEFGDSDDEGEPEASEDDLPGFEEALEEYGLVDMEELAPEIAPEPAAPWAEAAPAPAVEEDGSPAEPEDVAPEPEEEDLWSRGVPTAMPTAAEADATPGDPRAPQSIYESLEAWSGLRPSQQREAAAAPAVPREEPTRREPTAEAAPASDNRRGKDAMVDALLRFMGPRS